MLRGLPQGYLPNLEGDTRVFRCLLVFVGDKLEFVERTLIMNEVNQI